MKKILFVLFCFGYFNANSQIVQSSCIANDSILAKYKDDADRLALMRILRIGSSFTDSVNIPTPYSDTVLNALLAVYNAYSLPARDSVIEIFNIHAFPSLPLRDFTVWADSNLLWMQNLRNEIIPTGDGYVDSLIYKYNLIMKAYYPFNSQGYHVVNFAASNNLNVEALTDIWETIPGVQLSSPAYLFGYGSNIQDSVYYDHIEIIYVLDWACPYSGCYRHHYWKFNIYYDCTVEFMESYGDPISVLGIYNEEEEPITVAPNPFHDNIKIKGLHDPFIYSISNALGKIQISGISENGELKNLNKLEKGIYILTIILPKSRINFKIIKE
jgi:hypothetical protein